MVDLYYYTKRYFRIRKFKSIAYKIVNELAKMERNNMDLAGFFHFYNRVLSIHFLFKFFFYFLYDYAEVIVFKFALGNT